jgi:hypothetical protein
MKRRTLLAGVTSAFLPTYSTFVRAQETPDVEFLDDIPPLPTELQQFASEPPAPYIDVILSGAGKPSEKDKKLAYEILVGAPIGVSPIDVAKYFHGVGKGNLGAELRRFAREWPRTANPIIFHFFSATKTKPEGDVTAWCAAFMNWCLMRSRATSIEQIGSSPGDYSKSGISFTADAFEKYATRNASSGSFRCWKSISNPKEGDILVLANKGTQDFTPLCLGTGHVTFFVKQGSSANTVEVLGGNQVQSGSGGAVTRANTFIGQGSRFLKFVSFEKNEF